MASRKLLTVGHSYVVGLNRRLAHEIQRVSNGRWDVTICAPTSMQGDLSEIRLAKEDEDTCRLEGVDVRFSNRIHFLQYARKLKDICLERWDLIHCWEEPYVVACAQVACLAKKTPFVPYTYQNISKWYPPPFSIMERYVLSRCSGWISGGETTSQTLLRRKGYSDRPFRQITLGVDVQHFQPSTCTRKSIRESLGWKNDGIPVVGFLGRFTEEKGLLHLTNVLEACSSPWRALFVGGGVLNSFLLNWGKRYGDRVAVINGVNHAAVPAYLNAMDILAAPSQTTPKWREQLGRMLIEAFACGVPVIASDSGEIPYVVSDAGAIVGEKNLDAWVATLERLLNSPAERERLGQAGLERAHSCFAWPVIARQHCDFFDMILDSRSTS